MKQQEKLLKLASECREELTSHILPYWIAQMDANGGFYGKMSPDLTIDKFSPKGTIQTARILWAFSKSISILQDETYLPYAKQAFLWLRNQAQDQEHKGYYWSVNVDGTPDDDQKYTYCQSFVIYALTAYYEATGLQEALDMAYDLFLLTEQKSRIGIGYGEAFDRTWNRVPDDHLSEHDLGAERTMNTTLHLMEAYTELYRFHATKDVEDALCYTLSLMQERIYNPEQQSLRVFFDEDFQEIGDIHSFGHDIEATWLIDRACSVLKNQDCSDITVWTPIVAEQVRKEAFLDHSVINEYAEGVLDQRRVWWVQAESVVGYLNAYERTGSESFLDTAIEIWDFIKEYQIDKRVGGEWHSELDEQFQPLPCDVAGPWKCPYHNGRMCLEVIQRTGAQKA